MSLSDVQALDSPTNERDVISFQRQLILDTLRPLVPPRASVALLDFPNHNNVGDNAIWLGEKAYLRTVGAEVVYQCDRVSYSAEVLRARLGRDGIILLHGGGNFGTVWPAHQAFREAVVGEFPDHRIVQLPQSVHFEDERSAAMAHEALHGHPHLTVLVRDERSLRFVESTLQLRARLCPDMAFMMGPLARPIAPASDVMWLGRTDRESRGPLSIPATRLSVLTADWLAGEPGVPWSHAGARVTVRLRRLSHALLERSALTRRYGGERYAGTFDYLAKRRVARGCRILSRGRVVITDRLHGHILSLLLGIPHVILDNNYGKLRAYWTRFTRGAPGVLAASTPEEALLMAEGLLQDG